MKKYFVFLFAGLLLFGDWSFVANRAGGEKLYWLDNSIKKIDDHVVTAYTGSVYQNESTTERETRIDCRSKIIAYGETVSKYPNGTTQKYYLAKRGWQFHKAIDDAEQKMVEMLCAEKQKINEVNISELPKMFTIDLNSSGKIYKY